MCDDSSSVATEELASHTHNSSISTASITGDISDTGSETNKITVSGVFSKKDIARDYNGRSGGNSDATTINMQASHSHTISVYNAGGNQTHENRMPYTVINRWKRTA